MPSTSGVITKQYVDTLHAVCTSIKTTASGIARIFDEFRFSLSRTASTCASSSSRRLRGRRSDSVHGAADRHTFDAPCTWEPGQVQCWLLSELQPWNKILSRSYMELYEHQWGELTLRAFIWPERNSPHNQYVLETSLLVHLLMKQHRCVTRVLMDETDKKIDMGLFWHALKNGGAGVRHLEFVGRLGDPPSAKRPFHTAPRKSRTWCHSVASLSVLDSLHMWSVIFDEEAACTLGSYLLRTTTLKCITLHNVQVEDKEAAVFLEYLARNTTVTSLMLQGNFVKAKNGHALARVTRNHVALKQLDICGTDEYTPSAVLRAAVQSASLESLSVRFFTVNPDDISTMALALTIPPLSDTMTCATARPTSRLESLAFFGCTSCEPSLQYAYAGLIGGVLVKLTLDNCSLNEAFANHAVCSLRRGGRLRVLDIRNNKLPVCSILSLVKALEVNSVLKKMALNVHGWHPDPDLVVFFCTIKAMGVSSRIDIDWKNPSPFQVKQGGGLCRAADFYVEIDEWTAEDVRRVLEPLFSGSNVTTACIECSSTVEDDVVQQLTNALGNTKSLRELNLLLDWPESSIVNLLRSLEHNRSLSVLTMGRTTFGKRTAKALARLVIENHTLNKIFVELGGTENNTPVQLRTVCRELKDALPHNRFLTDVAVNLLEDGGPSADAIKAILRRNRMLVNQAVHFIKGSNDKKDALAFETLQNSRSLLKALYKFDNGDNEALAKEQIAEARRKLGLNYFIYTGVVKANIVCTANQNGKKFDDLPKDMQALMFSYLSLTDVIDI